VAEVATGREAEAWFARESYVLSALQHPLIRAFYGVFHEGGHSYIAQEYIEGETLNDLVRRQGPVEKARAGSAHDAGAAGRASPQMSRPSNPKSIP
jgi:serine/threonine-protein kinase